jgi:hypothetical protein
MMMYYAYGLRFKARVRGLQTRELFPAEKRALESLKEDCCKLTTRAVVIVLFATSFFYMLSSIVEGNKPR